VNTLLEKKFVGISLVETVRCFHGSQRFIAAVTEVCHWTLTGTISIRYTLAQLISASLVLVRSTHLQEPK